MIRAEPGFYLAVLAAFVAVAVLSAVVPALRVTRLRIVDALGHI
jgi:ABC-type antimicrobial peptide transport system permease subunit